MFDWTKQNPSVTPSTNQILEMKTGESGYLWFSFKIQNMEFIYHAHGMITYLSEHAIRNGDHFECRYCAEDLGVHGFVCGNCFFTCDECFVTKHVIDQHAYGSPPAYYPGGVQFQPDICSDCFICSEVPDVKEPEEINCFY